MRPDGGFKLMRLVLAFLIAAVIALSILVTLAFSTIQTARQDTIVRACQETNQNHDSTIQALDFVLAQVPQAQQRQAQQGRKNTILLIDALAPKHDCAKRAQNLTK